MCIRLLLFLKYTFRYRNWLSKYGGGGHSTNAPSSYSHEIKYKTILYCDFIKTGNEKLT